MRGEQTIKKLLQETNGSEERMLKEKSPYMLQKLLVGRTMLYFEDVFWEDLLVVKKPQLEIMLEDGQPRPGKESQIFNFMI